jgi:hypothetical protein
VVAAWPAVSLVGSYELLAWMVRIAAAPGPDRVPEADHPEPPADQDGSPADQMGREPNGPDQADREAAEPDRAEPAGTSGPDHDVNVAAVTAYRASVQAGNPLSERGLAGMFGKTSRRWARGRMAEAGQIPA